MDYIEDEDKETNEEESDSSEYYSDEIPIWIRGDKRWISGVTEETTCSNLVYVLLVDEGIINDKFDGSDAETTSEYVITERWRNVEQILNGETRILKIWLAWGESQSEVRLTLRKIECSKKQETIPQNSKKLIQEKVLNDKRRHCHISKPSTIKMINSQTIHPRSRKSDISTLLKCILEQGETIQKQLEKLRDKELEINQIEQDRHCMREKRDGKHYLIESYLKGLPDITKNEETQIPYQSDEVTNLPCESNNQRISEEELKSTEESSNENNTAIQEQITILQKIVQINKNLQIEEKSIIRLNTKIKKYELEKKNFSENEILHELEKLNNEIETGDVELDKMKQELVFFKEILSVKCNMIDELCFELGDETINDSFVTSDPADKQTLLDEKIKCWKNYDTINELDEIYVNKMLPISSLKCEPNNNLFKKNDTESFSDTGMSSMSEELKNVGTLV